MDVIQLNALARKLREVALLASRRQGDTKLSVTQIAVIEAVARKDGISIAEIVEATGLAQSWVSKIVTDLAKDGVFTQWKSSNDQRRTLVALSDDARRMTFADRGTTPIDESLLEVNPNLTREEANEVLRLLESVNGLLSKHN